MEDPSLLAIDFPVLRPNTLTPMGNKLSCDPNVGTIPVDIVAQLR
jgi:hypothetical protein